MPKIWSNNITDFVYIALALGHNVNVTSKQTLSTEVHTQDKIDVQKRHTHEMRPSERTLTHFKNNVQKRNIPEKMPYVSLQSQPQNHEEIVCCSLFVESVCCSLFVKSVCCSLFVESVCCSLFLKSVCCSLLQAVAFCRSLFVCVTVVTPASPNFKLMWNLCVIVCAVCCSVLHLLPFLSQRQDNVKIDRLCENTQIMCKEMDYVKGDIPKRPIYNTEERNGAIEENFAACHSWQQQHNNALQHTATHCNTLNTLQHIQHTATHSSFMTTSH